MAKLIVFTATQSPNRTTTPTSPDHNKRYIFGRWWFWLILLVLGAYALHEHGSFKIPGIFEANTKQTEKQAVVADTGKPNQPPVENIQKVEKDGKGFQNNGTNYGNQAVDMTIKVYSSNEYTSLDNSIRKQVFNKLIGIKIRYPDEPPITFWNDSRNTSLDHVLDDLYSLLHSAEISAIPRGQGNIMANGFEEPLRVLTKPVDTPYINKVLNALNPYLKITPKYDSLGGGNREIRFYIQGTLFFNDKGCVYIR
jgi:hypothetical protein